MQDWTLTYHGYVPEQAGLREALCALGNGYLVSRAALSLAEADGTHYPGTYLAGGYNRLTTELSGQRIENEDLVNLPSWLPLTLRIGEGEWLRPGSVEHLEHRQSLCLRDGILTTILRLKDVDGRVTRLDERRIVSMRHRHLAALSLTVTPENWSGPVTLRSALDGGVENAGVARYRELAGRHLETLETGEERALTWLRSRTVQSRREIALAARLRLVSDDAVGHGRRVERQPDAVVEELRLDAQEGRPITLEKIAAYFATDDPATTDPGQEARAAVARADGFATLAAAHAASWEALWEAFDLRLEADDGADSQLKLRLNRFHLLQTVSPHTMDLDVGVPPRGWHGEAYRGHIMWDELFILPSLNFHLPEVTRSVLGYRYRRLPAARRAAREAGHAGAMFPWQSGSNGREESQRVHLNPLSGRWVPDNSRRQRHIGVAVAFNVWKYYQVTDDWQFLFNYGAELIFEIARFFSSLAEERPDGRFDIKGVMGPDEFHTAYPEADPAEEGGLDNNAYTNVMVAWLLACALDVVDLLPDERRRWLFESVGVDDAECERWDRISRGLVVPFEEGGIISQFEGFGALEEFPFEAYRETYDNLRRLDRILEKEGDHPNRYQISKQADVLMLFYLFSREELQDTLERLGYRFDPDLIFRNIRHYMRRTVHGSTLSWVVHAWVLSRADRQQSWQLARTALNSDFKDLQGGTTPEGIHLGAMAGTVDLMERCYTGLEVRGHGLVFNPHLPHEVARLRTTVRYRRQVLEVDVSHDMLTITSRPTTAWPVTIAYRNRARSISPGQCFSFRLFPERKEDRPARARELERVRSEGEAARPGGIEPAQV